MPGRAPAPPTILELLVCQRVAGEAYAAWLCRAEDFGTPFVFMASAIFTATDTVLPAWLAGSNPGTCVQSRRHLIGTGDRPAL